MSQTEVAASPSTLARDDSWVWVDGEFARYRDAKLGVMTHALHYGTGCFEGIRAYWNSEREQLYVTLLDAHPADRGGVGAAPAARLRAVVGRGLARDLGRGLGRRSNGGGHASFLQKAGAEAITLMIT